MNFLVDAHLPRRLARRLQEAGHDALHTLDLPRGNRTTDTEINAISLSERRVVITKDADFVNSFWQVSPTNSSWSRQATSPTPISKPS
jgi:predicted nuclease of predicted toxin-antitoxin system